MEKKDKKAKIPEICYQTAEGIDETSIDLAFDVLFDEVERMGVFYPQSPKNIKLTPMHN